MIDVSNWICTFVKQVCKLQLQKKVPNCVLYFNFLL